VQAWQPLSVLCMAVLHQGKPMGLLYLENNLVRDAFTHDDVELIGILASQAAISFTIINDILSLSKIEAGKLETTPSDFDLTLFLQIVDFIGSCLEPTTGKGR
jgi:signal transduction histidine kinase